MTVEQINIVGIAGAGTMGQGIAQVFASAGYHVKLFDVHQPALDKAKTSISSNLDIAAKKGKISLADKSTTLNLISFENEITNLKADLIIEAIIENLDVKIQLFKTIESFNDDNCIFATNTSSIPVTQIGRALKNPAQLVGLHFFNPAQIMKLVEIIAGASTSPELIDVMKALCEKINKISVVAKDSPGFIVNRVARNYYVESLKILEEGVADVQGIDKLLESSGFKMGPFALMDLIGVDTNFSVTTSMYNAFHQDPKFRPSRIQKQKVDAGHHGRKSGKGFYEYPEK